MNKTFATIALLVFPLITFAHNKVVVVPLGADIPVRIYYGSVTELGALETGNIDSASQFSTGRYDLDFGSPVFGRAITVTKGTQGSGGTGNITGNMFISVPITGNIIRVTTYNSTFAVNDTDFHFTSICPP